jgi:BMFP domain-containing protein YqiC
MIKSRFERFIADMDFVPRDEFEAVKAMASKARSENDSLAKRVAALEEELRGKDSASLGKSPDTRSVPPEMPKL